MATQLRHDCAYRAEGQPGVAWVVIGPEIELLYDDDYGDVEERETGRVLAHMVGDDVPFSFDPEDLHELEDEEWCPGCGQIGCGWGH